MLMIRFQRIGRTNDAAFRIAVLEKERSGKSGRVTDLVGTYNPRSKALTINAEKVKQWIAQGAQPTGSVHNLLIAKGILEGKKVNVVSKKALKSKAAEASPAPEAAAPATPAAA
jgi:small subunit ribosomal protein S16